MGEGREPAATQKDEDRTSRKGDIYMVAIGDCEMTIIPLTLSVLAVQDESDGEGLFFRREGMDPKPHGRRR